MAFSFPPRFGRGAQIDAHFCSLQLLETPRGGLKSAFYLVLIESSSLSRTSSEWRSPVLKMATIWADRIDGHTRILTWGSPRLGAKSPESNILRNVKIGTWPWHPQGQGGKGEQLELHARGCGVQRGNVDSHIGVKSPLMWRFRRSRLIIQGCGGGRGPSCSPLLLAW